MGDTERDIVLLNKRGWVPNLWGVSPVSRGEGVGGLYVARAVGRRGSSR